MTVTDESRQFLRFTSPERDCQRKFARSVPLKRGVQSVSLHRATQRSNAEADVAARGVSLDGLARSAISKAEPPRYDPANATSTL